MRWVDLFTNFEVHQFDYKTEEAKQAFTRGLLQYVTKKHHGTLKDTEEGLSSVQKHAWCTLGRDYRMDQRNQDERLELEMLQVIGRRVSMEIIEKIQLLDAWISEAKRL